jgi:RNA polymerase sigma factor (sigma-70 family)
LASTTSPILCHHGQTIESCSVCRQRTHTQLVTNIDTLLADARPRLLRLARMNGISQDVADDIVQETLVEAWRHLENLHSPERFSAWLDGICRNVCRRHDRAQRAPSSHHLSLSEISQDDNLGVVDDLSFDIPDPQSLDPFEELDREDTATLLDRALAYLPSETRELVELCYLAELPQREVAERLQLTTGALELRLHRARRLLRQVLNGELRAEAEAFGILDAEQSSGWQETRQWCWFCGKQRMRGIFERQPDGKIGLRLRCPECSNRYNLDMTNTINFVSMEGLRSFRPAIKRALHAAHHHFRSMLTDKKCFICKMPVRIQIGSYLEYCGICIPDRFYLAVECPCCGQFGSDILAVYHAHPVVHRFITQHTRWISEPNTPMEFEGQQVIHASLVDLTTSERLTILVHPQTLQVIATFLE